MPRRVVTGNNAAGRSVVASDEDIVPTTFSALPGNKHYSVWGSDGPYSVPTDGTKPDYRLNHPEPGGFRSMVFVFQPASTPFPKDLDLAEFANEMERKLPGARRYIDENLMETTPSVDIGVVLEGEITLVLDDGVEVTLYPGDFVVQNGTRHTWVNKTEEPARVNFTLISADVVPPT